MSEQGFIGKSVQGTIKLASDNMSDKDKAFSRFIFGKTITLGMIVACITLTAIVLLLAYGLINGFSSLSETLQSGLTALSGFLDEAFANLFFSRTEIRRDITDRPDIPAIKAEQSERESPADISGSIERNGGIGYYTHPVPVTELQLEQTSEPASVKEQ